MVPVMCAAAAENVLIVTAEDTQRQIHAPDVTEQACVLIVRGQEKSSNLMPNPLYSVRRFADKIA